MKNQTTIKRGAMLALAATTLVLLPLTAAAGDWTARSVSELIADINAANLTGGANTITLARGKTFTLTTVNNTTDGPTGLPVIVANNNLTIWGNGATITRSTAPGTPAFRLFDVAPGAALTLEGLTVAHGRVVGEPSMDSATILNSTFMNNRAVGAALSPGATAGFYSASLGGGLSSWGGALYVRDSSFVGNQAIGGDSSLGGPASMAMGGGITVFNGLPATIINCSLLHNTVMGGAGGNGAPGAAGVGGGLNAGIFPEYGSASGPSSAVTLTGTTISHNQAVGGAGGGQGLGGGYAVGTGVLFGIPDTSSVTLNGGSVVNHNQPDDAFHF